MPMPKASFEELMQFPCDVTFRVIIEAAKDISPVIAVMEKSTGHKLISRLGQQASSKGKYQSHRLVITVDSAADLRRVYAEVSAHPDVYHTL